jgi:hypothetical protein
MNLQITAEGAAASSSKGMLSGSGPADIQIGQAAPGAALEDEASQGAGGRIHEASLSEVDPHFDHNPTWLTPPEPRKAGDGWSVVGEAWRKMGSMDTRALIVWGVPVDIPASAVHCVLGNAVEECKWVGVGHRRHVRVLYSSSRARDRELSRAQVGCKRLGWRAALSRSWQRRNEHRQRLAATSAVAVSNPFQALEASEENVQSRAFLSREWPSGPRDDGAEAREFWQGHGPWALQCQRRKQRSIHEKLRCGAVPWAPQSRSRKRYGCHDSSFTIGSKWAASI